MGKGTKRKGKMELSKKQKEILLKCNLFGEEGICKRDLVYNMGFSERSVERAISLFEYLGLTKDITREKRKCFFYLDEVAEYKKDGKAKVGKTNKVKFWTLTKKGIEFVKNLTEQEIKTQQNLEQWQRNKN